MRLFILIAVFSVAGQVAIADHFKHCTEQHAVDGLSVKSGYIRNIKGNHNTYFSNERCRWLITIPLGSHIAFQFLLIDLEESSDGLCRYDYVAIYEGGEADESKQIAKQCAARNNQPKRFNSSSATTSILVFFKTDGSGQKKGFELKWQRIDPGEELTETKKVNSEKYFVSSSNATIQLTHEMQPANATTSSVSWKFQCPFAIPCHLLILGSSFTVVMSVVIIVVLYLVISRRNPQRLSIVSVGSRKASDPSATGEIVFCEELDTLMHVNGNTNGFLFSNKTAKGIC